MDASADTTSASGANPPINLEVSQSFLQIRLPWGTKQKPSARQILCMDEVELKIF